MIRRDTLGGGKTVYSRLKEGEVKQRLSKNYKRTGTVKIRAERNKWLWCSVIVESGSLSYGCNVLGKSVPLQIRLRMSPDTDLNKISNLPPFPKRRTDCEPK